MLDTKDKRKLKSVYKPYRCPRDRKHHDFYLDEKRGLVRCVICNGIVTKIDDIINNSKTLRKLK